MPSPKPPAVDREAGTQAAIAARRARAAIKQSLREGTRSPLDVLAVANADRTSAEASLRMTDFLLCLRALGVKKVPVVLEQLGVSARKRLGFLGKRQHQALYRWLHQRAGTVDVERLSDGKCFRVSGLAA